MIIKSLEDLQVNFNSENDLFDLTQSSFKQYGSAHLVVKYIVPKQFEMRMDLISDDLYKSSDYTDFLLWFNGVINPMNIVEGMELLYVSLDIIPSFYAPKENQEEVQQIFLNNSKVKRKDKKRDKFIQEKRAALPPTVNEVKNEQVKIKGDSIIIGGDIFNI